MSGPGLGGHCREGVGATGGLVYGALPFASSTGFNKLGQTPQSKGEGSPTGSASIWCTLKISFNIFPGTDSMYHVAGFAMVAEVTIFQARDAEL